MTITMNGKEYANVNEAMEMLKQLETKEKAMQMKIYKFTEIEDAYSQTVADFINKGYRVNVRTMSGTQGEQAHVDFTDGRETYRVRLERSIDLEYTPFETESWFRPNGMQMVIEKFEFSTRDNIWNGRGEFVSAETWFALGDGYGVDAIAYIKADDYEAYREHRKKIRSERYDAKKHQDAWCGEPNKAVIFEPKHIDKVIEMCKKYRGWKNVKEKDIKHITRKYSERYGVSYEVEKNSGKSIEFTTRRTQVWG